MSSLSVTGHAAIRMAQRGINLKDADLIALIGTEVEDGYFVREKDYQEVERQIKHILHRFKRLIGKRIVVTSGQIVTAYHASRRHQGRLLRRAQES